MSLRRGQSVCAHISLEGPQSCSSASTDGWWWESYPFYQKIKQIGWFGIRTGQPSFGLDLVRGDAGRYKGTKRKYMLFPPREEGGASLIVAVEAF